MHDRRDKTATASILERPYSLSWQSYPDGNRKTSNFIYLICVTVALTLLGMDSAGAQSACTGSSDTYTCSGTTTTPVSLSGSSLSLTAGSTFQATFPATGSSPFSLVATGSDLGFTQLAGSSIYGAANASIVSLQNNGIGSTIASINGTISGVGPGPYLYVFNGTNTQNLTVALGTSGSISGINSAFVVSNNGTGAATISTAGSIGSSSGDALDVYNSGLTTDLTVNQTAGSITSAYTGILANNSGTGATIVNQTGGSITSTSGEGINATNSSAGTTVSVTASNVSAVSAAIDVTNRGTGATTITTSGTIASSNNVGIFVNGYSTGTTTINQTAGTIAGNLGMLVTNTGAGQSTLIQTAGDVTGQNGTGIQVSNGPSAVDLTINQTAGSILGRNGTGILANNTGTGATTVNQTGGSIAGQSGDGISASNTTLGTSVSVTAANVSGTANGIDAVNGGHGATTVSVSGMVTGTGTTAVLGPSGQGVVATNYANATDLTLTQTAGSITGANAGVLATNNGTGATTVNQTGGSITGQNGDGIQAGNGATGTTLAVAATNVSGTTNGIEATNNGSGATIITASGSVTGGSGAGIASTSLSGSAVAITLRNGASVSATSGTAIHDTAGNATVTMESGSKLSGAVMLGAGNDTLIVKGTADIGGATLLDGGNSLDSSVTDILGTSGAATNKFSFSGTSQSLAGAILKNWQTVQLDASAVTLTDGTLTTGTGTNTDASLQGLVLTNGSTLTSSASLALIGDVAIDASSTLWQATGGSIAGNVTNAGLIYWGNLGHTLTVNGNYTGVAGSSISLETYLAGDNSTTDKLHVTGNTSGATAVVIRPVAGSPGAQTVNGIDIIQVDGTSAAGSFTMASPVQAGAYQYVLKQGSSLSANDWYLVSHYIGTNTNGDDSIYRSGVADYVGGQALNAEQGIFAVSTFHQRMGDQRAADAEGRQTWIRPLYYGLNGEGSKRFGYTDGQIYGTQVGQELWVNRDDSGTTTRVAATLDYARIEANFNDRLRPLAGLAAKTGSLDGESIGIGGTYTRMDASGVYLDIVGQAAFLHNKYSISDTGNATQNGVRGTVSTEIGKPFAVGDDWWIEPQGQLIYMHTEYDGFSDPVSSAAGYGSDVLRGRIGARISNDVLPAGVGDVKLYGIVDVSRDFIRPSAVDIGGSKVSEDFRHTLADVGLGAQYPVSKVGALYGNAVYFHALDNGETYGYQLDFGVKVAF